MSISQLAKSAKVCETVSWRSDRSRLSSQVLKDENRRFKGTGGVSQDNRLHGFVPAFCDSGTGTFYLSRFSNGRVVPIHLLDGLPPELIVEKTMSRTVITVRESVIAGFMRDNLFYTRQQVAAAVNSKPVAS